MEKIMVATVLSLIALVASAGPPENAGGGAATIRVASSIAELHELAKAGNVANQVMLGMYYEGGKYAHLVARSVGEAGKDVSLPPNDDEAAKWYRLAANQGRAFAQFKLGLAYELGRGVPQNYVEAVRWYRLAANQGEAGAQARFGFLYFSGTGVPQDYAESHKWLNLAASRESDAEIRADVMKARDIVVSRMTPAQIAEAQRLAREWKPTPSRK